MSDDNLENVGFGALERQPNTQDRKAFTKIELGPSVEVSDAVNVGFRLLFPQLIVVHRSTMIIGVEVSFLRAHSLQVRVVTLPDNQCMYPMSMSRAPKEEASVHTGGRATISTFLADLACLRPRLRRRRRLACVSPFSHGCTQ